MASAASFVSIQDANIFIPDEVGVNDLHRQFELPGLSGKGVLFFRLGALEDSTSFHFRLNRTQPLRHNLDRTPTRSFHETYPLDTLSEEANELTIFVIQGKIVVSDIIFLYQVSI